MLGYVVMLMKDSEGKRQTPAFCADGRNPASTGIYSTYSEAEKLRTYLKSIYPKNWYAIAHVNNQTLEE